VANQIKRISLTVNTVASQTDDVFVLEKLQNILEDCHLLARYLLAQKTIQDYS
jgi:hypothetical protein